MNGTFLKAMIFFLTLSSSFLFSDTASSRTEIRGVIDEDTKWTVNHSPYLLSENVVVQKDACLSIERNVVVIFSKGTRFFVQGRLDAYRAFFNGFFDVNNEEVFQYLPEAKGDLIRCAFVDLSLVFETSDVRLSTSVVSNRNGTGVTIGKGASPTVSDSSFHGNSYFAAYQLGKTPIKLTNCFWGAENGPSREGDGSGDAVGPNILFKPFQTKERFNFLLLYEMSVQKDTDNSDGNIQLGYHLVNMNATEHKVVLGASVHGPKNCVYHDPTSDIHATVPPGFHRYGRLFTIPPHAHKGLYDIHCSVMNDSLSEYYAYVRVKDGINIQDVHLLTSRKKIPFTNPDG